VTRLVLGFEGDANVDEELAVLRSEFERIAGENSADLRVYGWRRFVRVIVRAVEADIAGFSVIIAVLYLLIVVGILNSMSMAVHERTKEIGTLRAIGMKRAQLRVLFLAEGASIAALGALVGALIAGAGALYLGLVGFDLSILAGTGLPIPFGDRFTADFTVWDFLLGAGVAVATAAVGTLLPLRRASKLNIAAALGSHLE
jgi:putative ABC transport system permease protein